MAYDHWDQFQAEKKRESQERGLSQKKIEMVVYLKR